VLPAVLALSIGVGALAAGYTSQVVREQGRERFERGKSQAYLDAWAQMEVVASVIEASGYDGSGRNRAIQQALARPDRSFIDRDGWLTHVAVNEIGGAGSGYFELISTAQVEEARSRVSALVRERQSFSDFVYFTNRHALGIAGGVQAAWPYSDSPEGSIHSNQSVQFYFADRHFRDPVTATRGFGHNAGATAANQSFHGPNDDAAEEVTGLMDIVPADLGTRSDTLLNLNGPWDSARVQLRGPTIYVEHWVDRHSETQIVPEDYPVYRTDTLTREVLQPVIRTGTRQDPVYATRDVWQNDPYSVQITDAAGYFSTERQQVRVAPFQVWVADDGSSGTAGGAVAGGAAGTWQDIYNYEWQDVQVWHPPVTHWETRDFWHWVTQTYVSGYQTVPTTYTEMVSSDPPQFEDYTVQVIDHWETRLVERVVTVPETRVATHLIAATGTMYVANNLTFLPVAASQGYASQPLHVLNGSFTFAAGRDISIRDSIVYGQTDAAGEFRPAYLNGSDRTKPYEKNPAYTGSSVLGLIAGNDILLDRSLPDQVELNATLLASRGEFRVTGVNVSSAGTVTTSSSGSFVKSSYRSLGGVISNQRPVTVYVDASNTIVRGFTATKSVFDNRQRTNPPRGFPTLNRPRLLAQVIREVN
jgi:hypothetical protein